MPPTRTPSRSPRPRGRPVSRWAPACWPRGRHCGWAGESAALSEVDGRNVPAEPLRPPRVVLRRDAGTWGLQSALERRGLGPVAGVDEAGRGACAGPLVIASCVLRAKDANRLSDLTDSKLLSEPARER